MKICSKSIVYFIISLFLVIFLPSNKELQLYVIKQIDTDINFTLDKSILNRLTIQREKAVYYYYYYYQAS